MKHFLLLSWQIKFYFHNSWHEIGYYDLPALIDYIVEKTGNPDMHYIGYSQGTTAFFVMASERPEYNDKIKGMVCLAPIAYLGNHRSPLLKCVVPLHIVMKVRILLFNCSLKMKKKKRYFLSTYNYY